MTNDIRERVAARVEDIMIDAEDTPISTQELALTLAEAAIAEMGGVRVKPLTWYGKPDGQDIRIGRCDQISYSVGFKMGRWGYQRCGSKGHVVSYKGGPIFTCEADAIDGADIDHEAHILAAIEPAPVSVREAARVLCGSAETPFLEPASAITKELRQYGYLVPVPVTLKALRAFAEGQDND